MPTSESSHTTQNRCALKPEVLSPAGSPEALDAALRAGADAVYLGVTDYNARIRATNFTLDELPEVIAEAHRWGVRIYITFNTLVFSEEEAGARRALESIARAGADAVIVQDLGVVRWIHEIAPDLPVHASTQMTVTSADGIAPLARLGVRRVILARELSVAEIARIRAATSMELEVFVHGALCVSYSGQCLSSEAWGGRSANRGQCAQACRLPYDLLVDERIHDLGDRAYLLSPRDLEGYRRIPELIAAGISTVKIEGRMKGAAYVSAATRLYRNAVDRAWEMLERAEIANSRGTDAKRPAEGAHFLADAKAGDRGRDFRAADLGRLAWDARQVYSRGASEGFLGGVNHQVLVDGRTRSHRGILVGRVARVDSVGVIVDLDPEIRLAAGDGLLFAITPLEEDEQGGRVQSVEALSPGKVRISFARESSPDLHAIPYGTPVYRTAHPELLSALRDRMHHAERPVLLTLRVTGSEGTSLEVRATDPEGREVVARSRTPLQTAHKNALDEARLREQLGRLGETRYQLGALEIDLAGELFLPVSELNQARREIVEEFERLRAAPLAAPWEDIDANRQTAARTETSAAEEASPIVWAVLRAEAGDRLSPAHDGSHSTRSFSERFEDSVLVLCRDRMQLETALRAGMRRIGLDFLDLVGLKEATIRAREKGAHVTLALPRIQKPGEEKIEGYFLAREPDEILVRSLASLERLRLLTRSSSSSPLPTEGVKGAIEQSQSSAIAADVSQTGVQRPRLVGDVSLNGVNPAAIATLLELGLDRMAPGLDLNGEQLLLLTRSVDASRIEIPLYHHLPVFHTEHCVFAAFLSDGADFRTCGRPCDRHRIALRDRVGQEHPVIADVGCRNTVFGARPQSALPFLRRLRALGVERFRIELVSESAPEIGRILALHREVWNGTRDVATALRELKAEGRYGVSTGAPEPSRPKSEERASLRPTGRNR